MLKRKTNEKGFTLIEVIVTLVLVGIAAVFAGMWIVSVVNGYVFTKMNASTEQKAQLAMTRLSKEFSAINSISAASNTEITYTRINSALSTVGPYTVKVKNIDGVNKLQIITGAETVSNTGDTLTDSVSSGGFSLSYCNDIPSSGPQVCGNDWPTTGIRKIIAITLTLNAGSNTPVTFIKRVVPRNI